jgi:hypothetical protein
MPTSLIWKTLVVAILAAGLVWFLTGAASDSLVKRTGAVDADGQVVYQDNRVMCSGGVPYTTTDGVRVEPTLSPYCRYGPIPTEALGPNPGLAVATFVFVLVLGLWPASRRA